MAQPGQWVLLADVGVMPVDGDLIAAEDAQGYRYLRRAWSDGDRWLLHAINPVVNVPAIAVPKNASVQTIIGVLHQPTREPRPVESSIAEWQPRTDFDFDFLDGVYLVRVEGDSLNPIARQGQYVMVARSTLASAYPIPAGMLAAIDTTDPHIGQVIKCVYATHGNWILTSRNPVQSISPLVLSSDRVKSVWSVLGVLFEGAVREDGDVVAQAGVSGTGEATA